MNFEISEFSFVINVVFRVITAIIFIALLIPLVWKEALVKNGLKMLRYELLFTSTIIFFISTSGLFIVLLRQFGINTQLATEIVTLFNSIGFLAYALVKRKIYTQEYSPENKHRHAKLAEMEEAEKLGK